ncbi:MAG: ABC transporter ATP-binding protein [Acidimicrobiia bacterium]
MTTDALRASYIARVPAVELRHVGFSYEARGASVHALADISLEIDAGAFVSIVGPSGCGKTTLLQIVAGFAAPSTGTLTVAGQAVTGPDRTRGVVFQSPELYPWLSVRKNVEFGLKMRRVPRRERAGIADSYLELVGLHGFGDRRPYELSGGMQQRCQIARVLANDPEIVLMDEPFGALDALTRERLQAELQTIWRTTGKTVVFITHSVEEAAVLSTRVVALSARPGRIVLDRAAPFAASNRPLPELRADPEFVEFQRLIRAAIEP